VTGSPAAVTVIEDTESNVGLSAMTFADVDTAASLTVTLTANSGTFSTPVDGSGVGSGVTETLVSTTEITLAGTPTDINTYLDTAANIKYTGASNANGNAAATITVSASDSSASLASDPVVNLDITAVNDAPTGVGDLTLASINQGTTNPAGALVNALTSYSFQDVDTGATNSGILVVGNTANSVTQGAWQYTSDGTNWIDIGVVADDATALALAVTTQVRFVPITSFNGTPPVLSVRALDDSYVAAFSTTTGGTETRVNADSSANTNHNKYSL